MTTTTNNEQKKLNVPNKREQNQSCLDSAEREGLRPNGNVPNLRFPEFRGEWEKVRLGEECNMLCGYAFNGEDIVEQGSYLLMRGINITEGSIRHSSELDRYYSGSIEKLDKYKLAIGDLVIGMDGSKVGRNSAIVSSYEDGSYLVQRVCRIRSSIGNNYILQFINNTKFHQYVDTVKTSSAIPHISLRDIKNYRISIPSTQDETDKIAKLFLLLDERIATQNKIIEDLKKLKSAIIEKLYKEIQGTWYSYRQLFSIINERNKQLEYSNVLSASQERGMVSREDLNLDIHFERSNIGTYKIVKNGDYVIHLRSFQGGFAFTEKTGICSPAYTVLRPNNLLVYGYLSNYFTSRDFVKSLIIVTYGIRDGRSINVDEWLDMKVVIPSKEQQTHIVNVIESIENKIKNEETYSNCLLNQKQYLLRQMFI